MTEEPRVSEQNGEVVTTVYAVDWNDLAWNTLTLLGAQGPQPSTDLDRIVKSLDVLRDARRLGTIYANPGSTVVALPGASEYHFLRTARARQLAWLRQVTDVLGSAGARKRALKGVDAITRQLCFTGVLILNGKHMHPQRWPDGPDTERRLKDKLQPRSRRPAKEPIAAPVEQ